MGEIIGECAAQLPHPDWDRFREIPYDGETSTLSPWLHRAFGQGWHHSRSKGLWVGLIQVDYDGEMAADMYAAASPSYDPASLDWAYEVKVNGSASDLKSKTLATIYRLAYGRPEGLGNDAEYPLVLTYGAIAVREALEAGPLPAALQSLQGAAVGFDSGDILFLGEFVDGKFVARPREG
jgi:hypothetical protein